MCIYIYIIYILYMKVSGGMFQTQKLAPNICESSKYSVRYIVLKKAVTKVHIQFFFTITVRF